MITKAQFQKLERVLREAGYGPTIEWSERIQPPADADDFACRVIYVICNSGMRVTTGAVIAEKCIAALKSGRTATEVFGHPGKATAIDVIWVRREALFEAYCGASIKLDFLAELPWIGKITKLHLAKNLGATAAKPDVHLLRLAKAEGTTPARLCRRLAKQTNYKVQTIDTILWRACADGVLDSHTYELEGWNAAFRDPSAKTLPRDAQEQSGS